MVRISGALLVAGGGGSATLTPNDCVAVRPFDAVTVTVTVASPGPAGVTVRVLPETATVATLVLLEVAAYLVPLSVSLK